MAFLKITFFKRPKIRVFSYDPRYWDPERERLEERRQAIAKELGVTLTEEVEDPDVPYHSNIKGQMKHAFEATKRKNSKFTGGRLYILVLLILFVTAAYFGSNLFGLLFSGVNEVRENKELQQEEPKRPKNIDYYDIIPLP